MTVLKAEGLRKTFQMGAHRVDALKGVDLSVEEGEFVAIMGPSGSGKSTLLHLLGGLDQPSDGEVTLAGHRLSVLTDNRATLVRRHNVGFVFQFFNLLPTLTAEENIALPLFIDNKKLRDYQARIDSLLEMFGLTERRQHKPDQLSGGEQQRVSMARALVTQPAIVLADEPTGNLDTKTGTTVMELLRRSCDELNQAIIVVTHDPRSAAHADRVIFLRDGVIVHQLETSSGDGLSDRLGQIRTILEELEF